MKFLTTSRTVEHSARHNRASNCNELPFSEASSFNDARPFHRFRSVLLSPRMPNRREEQREQKKSYLDLARTMDNKWLSLEVGDKKKKENSETVGRWWRALNRWSAQANKDWRTPCWRFCLLYPGLRLFWQFCDMPSCSRNFFAPRILGLQDFGLWTVRREMPLAPFQIRPLGVFFWLPW